MDVMRGIEMMKSNVGTIDRVVRVLLGLAIVVAGLVLQNWLGAIGLVLLGTAAIGWCPLYRVLGLSTHRTQSGVPTRG